MLIPKSDKWVLVRWHGGGRSVLKAKYLLKFLPPGEDLKISTVVKIGRKDGAAVTATVLTSGNDHHQLQLLSEPGERQESPETRSPEPEAIENDYIEDMEEDFEESSSDWTPDGPDMEFSSAESETDTDTSKKSKPGLSKRRPSYTKKTSKKLSTPIQRRNASIASTLQKLACLNLGKSRTFTYDTRKKKREYDVKKRRSNINKPSAPFKKLIPEDDSIYDIINYMKTLFAGLFQVMVTVDPSFELPPEYKDVKVNILDSGDVVIMDDNYDYSTISRPSSNTSAFYDEETSEIFDKTLTPDESEDDSSASVITTVTAFSEKTLTPYESEDTSEPVKNKKTIAPGTNNKKKSISFNDEDMSEPIKNYRSSTPAPVKKKKTVATSDDEDSDYSDCSDRSDDPVFISNKYDTVKRSYNEPDEAMDEWIPIGSGTTLIHRDKFKKVNWKSYTIATRTLLLAAFSRRTLATHSLTGKKSPAFSHKPAKMCLDPKVVSDIVIEVSDRFDIRDNLVRSIITTKCADECKMRKMKKNKRKAQRQKETPPTPDHTNNSNENKNEEDMPQPGPSGINNKSSKKNQENMSQPGPSGINTNKDDESLTQPGPSGNNTSETNKSENEDMEIDTTKSNSNQEQEYTPPAENNTLKNINNNNQENMSAVGDNTDQHQFKQEYIPSPVSKSMKCKNQENIPPQENNTGKSAKKKNQEYVPLPVKDSVKSYKTYKNKSK